MKQKKNKPKASREASHSKNSAADKQYPVHVPPPPIKPVGTSWIPRAPKRTRMPPHWQMYCPRQLIPQTTKIIAEAMREFPVRSQIKELCKYLIVELEPHFCAAVQGKTLPADSALSNMSDLLNSFLAYNSDDSTETSQLVQDTVTSDEWLKLASEIAKVSSAAMNGADRIDRRAMIDNFITKLREEGRKITRKDIWTVAGYKNATEFERFQRGDIRTTKSAEAAFKRVLNMKPRDFIRCLEASLERK